VTLYEDNAGGLYLERDDGDFALGGLEHVQTAFADDAAEFAAATERWVRRTADGIEEGHEADEESVRCHYPQGWFGLQAVEVSELLAQPETRAVAVWTASRGAWGWARPWGHAARTYLTREPKCAVVGRSDGT
jgi:hypothetical protein